MSRDKSEEKLTLLGENRVKYPREYDPNLLETFVNKHSERDYWVKFNCPEFTTLCPITGQPDFATLTIRYIPDVKMVESKSLKLYLMSFRNHGDFHEDVVNIILDDLKNLLAPRYIEVEGRFLPRGGISIDPFVNFGLEGTRFEKLARKRFEEKDLFMFEKVDNR